MSLTSAGTVEEIQCIQDPGRQDQNVGPGTYDCSLKCASLTKNCKEHKSQLTQTKLVKWTVKEIVKK